MDRALLNALSEEVNKGNKQDGVWTSEAYTNMVNVLRSVVAPSVTKQHIKNRMKTLKDHFHTVHDLFKGLSGFAWNPTTRRFEAEEEVWQDLLKVKPHANRWRTMQIKYYDIKKELFGSDRVTGKQSSTTRMRNQQMHKENDPVEKDPVELNESSYVNTDLQEQNVGNFEEGIFSPPDIDSFCPNNGQSHQSTGTSGSRGTKRKASIADLVESQVERMTTGIGLLADALNNGNNISDQLHEVAKHQVVIAERQVAAIEKRNEIYQNQLTIFQHSRPRVYTEADVWDMLTEINVMEQYRMQCYEFLCSNEQKKRQIFGVPNHMRLVALSQMMNASKHK